MKLHLMFGSVALAGALLIVQGGLVAQAPPAAQGPRAGGPPAPQGPRAGGPAAPAGQGGRRGGGPAAPQGPQTGQAAALGDLTGYWVSVVNQDWYYRMITPPKGNYGQVPLNAAARTVADTFDPAQYGGPNYQTSG